MTDFKLSLGDAIAVVVTQELPYGVLVETMTGIPGMVAGVQFDVGARLRVRVTAIDSDKERFAADRIE